MIPVADLDTYSVTSFWERRFPRPKPRPKPRRNPALALILTPKKASLQNFSALILAMLLADLLGVAQA